MFAYGFETHTKTKEMDESNQTNQILIDRWFAKKFELVASNSLAIRARVSTLSAQIIYVIVERLTASWVQSLLNHHHQII